jgi:hypothetical protein
LSLGHGPADRELGVGIDAEVELEFDAFVPQSGSFSNQSQAWRERANFCPLYGDQTAAMRARDSFAVDAATR